MAGCITAGLLLVGFARAQQAVDIAQFGQIQREGEALVIQWRQPREVRKVVMPAGAGKGMSVEWWQSVWPDNGEGGWQKLDDPFRGHWVRAKGKITTGGDGAAFVFAPLDQAESPQSKALGAPYRRTFRLRITGQNISRIEAYGEAVWKEANVELVWKGGRRFEGEVEAGNGRIASFRPTDFGAQLTIRYADAAQRLSPDRGYVIFRPNGDIAFSVYLDDLAQEGGISVRDVGAIVRLAGRDVPAMRGKTVLQRIAELPEQSFEHAMQAMPAKAPEAAHLGAPNMRQEFTIGPTGDIFLKPGALRSPGKDMDRRPWNGSQVHYAISTGQRPDGERKVKRELEEGWLPVMQTRWRTGEIEYRQSALATLLRGDIATAEYQMRGDETMVLLDRIEMTNASQQEETASIWIEISSTAKVRLDDGLMLLEKASDEKPHEGLTPMRGKIETGGRGKLELLRDFGGKAGRDLLRYTLALKPGEKHAIDLAIPYVELLEKAELSALEQIQFAPKHDGVVGYWKRRLAEGMSYQVPDSTLNHLFKANFWHVLSSTDRDPASGLYQHGASTIGYANYPNESCMVIQSLEMRGEHHEAANLLEPYLAGQGKKPLPGNFKSKEGVFYSAMPTESRDPYTAQGYNMHHGWVLWTLAEHYRWTGDKQWLARVAPQLVAGCDWISRERQATKQRTPDGKKVPEWGLAPAGDLEDVDEYLYWYATNGYFWAGMDAAAKVLGEIGHPDAGRLSREAEEYRTDILASLQVAVAHAPAVKLRDGSYVPYVPQRVDVSTHLKEGWIRETLYPTLHLADVGLLPRDHPFVTWQLEDLEDNLFLSKESGYAIKDFDARFFDFGGFTMQPDLLPNATVYLRRDQIKPFLRSTFNMGAASLYPDVMCFAEWVPEFGKGAGPLYKTPDESKFIQFLRDMLVFEDGPVLKLGAGVPLAWMEDGKRVKVQRAETLFGKIDLEIISHAKEAKVEANVRFEARTQPQQILLRVRSPDGRQIKRVMVNGKPIADFDPAKGWITLPAGFRQGLITAYF